MVKRREVRTPRIKRRRQLLPFLSMPAQEYNNQILAEQTYLALEREADEKRLFNQINVEKEDNRDLM